MKLEFSQQSFKKYSNTKSMKIRPMGAVFSMQTDGQAWSKVALRNWSPEHLGSWTSKLQYYCTCSFVWARYL